MAVTELLGCLFLAFGPPLVMFVITIAKDPIRVIVLITRYLKSCFIRQHFIELF